MPRIWAEVHLLLNMQLWQTLDKSDGSILRTALSLWNVLICLATDKAPRSENLWAELTAIRERTLKYITLRETCYSGLKGNSCRQEGKWLATEGHWRITPFRNISQGGEMIFMSVEGRNNHWVETEHSNARQSSIAIWYKGKTGSILKSVVLIFPFNCTLNFITSDTIVDVKPGKVGCSMHKMVWQT